MSRPPNGLAFFATAVGLVLVALCAVLQIVVIDAAFDDGSGGVDRAANVATLVLNGVGTAGAFVLAFGILIGLWEAYARRGDA